MPRDMELVEYPQEMKDRIAAGKSAEPVGRFNIFVGNLAYSVAEDDLREVFEGIGAVAKVIIMTDDDGRPRPATGGHRARFSTVTSNRKTCC